MGALSTTAAFARGVDTGEFLRAMREVGCRTCQFYRADDSPMTVDAALGTARGAGLEFDSIHGVFSGSIDPSSPDAEHRRGCLRIYEKEAALAGELGGPMVVVHPSPAQTAARPGERGERMRALGEFLRGLGEVGERRGVTFLLENLPPDCPLGGDPREVAAAVRGAGSARVRMCFDTGHAHLSAAGGVAVEEAVRECVDVISYVHAHDNNGDADAHLMPGEGTIEWAAVGAALRGAAPDVITMLEVFCPAWRIRGMSEAERGALRGWLGVEG